MSLSLRPRAAGRVKLGLVLICFLVVVLAALSGDWGRRPTPTDRDGSVRFVFLGDVNLDGHPGRVIAEGGSPFAALVPVLADADLVVANLECVVATTGTPYEKPWTFRAHPRVLQYLAQHVGAVSLANNHTGDFGHEAFREQLGLLRRQRLPYFGGGANVVEARTPLLLERHGTRIALLGYNDYHPRDFEAGPSWPGVAWAVDAQMAADVEAARTIHHADLVVPFMHWGWEEYPADDRQKQLARLLIDHGADAVIGTHPHIVQEVETYRDKLIVYSLGNCVFEGFDTPETQLGWVLRLTLGQKSPARWDIVPIRLDPRGIPRLAPEVRVPTSRGTANPGPG